MNEFPDEISVAKIYESVAKTPVTANTTPRVITWNIRFGSARFPFYGDSCGDKVIAKKDDIKDNLDNIAAEINSMDPDIILLQEVDMFSKRSGYINQIQYLLDTVVGIYTLNYNQSYNFYPCLYHWLDMDQDCFSLCILYIFELSLPRA